MSEPLTFISISWIKPLLARLVKLRKNRSQELEEVTRTFGDPALLAKYYVEPSCQNTNSADAREDESISTVRAPIFKTINKFLNGNIVERDGASQLFLLADAGMGKTSVLLMLRLSNITAFWPRDYTCVLIKLGPDSMTKIRTVAEPRRTVLLLDALDEDQEAIGAGATERRLAELLTATRFFHRTIISCRTQFLPTTEEDPYRRKDKVRIGNFICPYLYLSLFDDGQVHEYLTKRFPRGVGDVISFRVNPVVLRAKRLVSRMGSLKFRPLLLSYVEDFLESDIPQWTPSAIYDTLITSWLLREIRKIREMLPDKSNLLDGRLLYLACAKLAFDMHLNGSKTISPKRLTEVVGSISTVVEGFQIESRSLLTRTSQGDYRFAHYSIQEFLVARALTALDKKMLSRRIRITDQILYFICNAKDFEKASHSITFEDTEMSRLTLSGVEVRDVPFARAVLRGANFSGSRLIGLDFSNANLHRADFRKCIFTNVNFEGANLEGAAFEGARFSEVSFKGAKLKAAAFPRCPLVGLSFENALAISADFTGANLERADLSGLQGEFARFAGASLKNAKLSSANLNSADFSKADLRDTSISKDVLHQFTRSAALSDPSLSIDGANFADSILDGS